MLLQFTDRSSASAQPQRPEEFGTDEATSRPRKRAVRPRGSLKVPAGFRLQTGPSETLDTFFV